MGLEPTTPCLQSRCSSQLSYVPEDRTETSRRASYGTGLGATERDGAARGAEARPHTDRCALLALELREVLEASKHHVADVVDVLHVSRTPRPWGEDAPPPTRFRAVSDQP